MLTGAWSWLWAWHVSLWKDEADSISAAHRSTGDLWRLVHHIDAVHAAYYALLHVWISVFGQSPAVLRLPSAIATGFAAAAAYLLAERLVDRRTALMTAVVFALLPRVTWMGIETRSFAIAAALGGWLVLVFVKAWAGGSARLWVLYAALAAVGVVVDIYLALVVLANGVAMLCVARSRRSITAWVIAAAAALVVGAPVVLESLGQRAQLGNSALGPVHLVRSVLVNQWFLGNTATSRPGIANLWKYTSVLLAVCGWALVLIGVWGVVTAREVRGRRALAVLVPWLVLPTVLVGGYTLLVSPLYSARYFTISAAPLAVLIAIGLTRLVRPAGRVTALVVLIALALPIYASQRRVDGKQSDWSVAAAFVAAHKGADQAVYFAPRAVPAGPVVDDAGTRLIAQSYPADFSGLLDLTLQQTPARAQNLVGRSSTLSAATPRLRGIDAVWVVRRRDYPAAAAAQDDALLRAAGFRAGRQLASTYTVVVEFVR